MPYRSLLIAILVAAPLSGQKLDRAEFNYDSGKVEVRTTDSADDFKKLEAAYNEPSRWKVLYRGLPIRVTSISVDRQFQGITFEYDPADFALPPKGSLQAGELAVLFQAPSGKVALAKNREFVAVKSEKKPVQLVKAAKDADINISGGLQAAVDAKPLYYWEVKAAYPFLLLNGWGNLGPSFEGSASKQTNADPDSLKAKLRYKNRWPVSGRKGFVVEGDLPSYEFESSIKDESLIVDGEIVQRKFLKKNANLLAGGEVRWVHGSRRINYQLGAGADFGKATSRTIKTDSSGREQTSVLRPRATMKVLKIWQDEEGKKPVELDGSYTLRWPLQPEPFQKLGLNGGKPQLSRIPRHWLAVNLGATLTPGIKLTAQYRYGALPPSYQFVNHRLTLGFSFLLRLPKRFKVSSL